MKPGEQTAVMEYLNTLNAAGWKPTYHDATDDGDYESIHSVEEAFDAIDSVDSCTITFTKGKDNMGILFVLGNDPSGCEVASDWNVSDENDFDKIVLAISDKLMP